MCFLSFSLILTSHWSEHFSCLSNLYPYFPVAYFHAGMQNLQANIVFSSRLWPIFITSKFCQPTYSWQFHSCVWLFPILFLDCFIFESRFFHCNYKYSSQSLEVGMLSTMQAFCRKSELGGSCARLVLPRQLL